MDIDVSKRDLLNAQTGRIAWAELQRHFAQGRLVLVAGELDLVEVSECFVTDDSARVKAWTEAGLVRPVLDEDARRWINAAPDFWAVVVAPWVLAQEIREEQKKSPPEAGGRGKN